MPGMERASGTVVGPELREGAPLPQHGWVIGMRTGRPPQRGESVLRGDRGRGEVVRGKIVLQGSRLLTPKGLVRRRSKLLLNKVASPVVPTNQYDWQRLAMTNQTAGSPSKQHYSNCLTQPPESGRSVLSGRQRSFEQGGGHRRLAACRKALSRSPLPQYLHPKNCKVSHRTKTLAAIGARQFALRGAALARRWQGRGWREKLSRSI